jgi:hypothetical protein
MDYSGPTYGEFMAAPVKAAIEAFGDDWDNQPAEAGGSVRSIITRPSGPFSPIVFIAALVTGPGGPHVLIDSFEDDPDYYNQFFLDDPEA